MFTVIGVLRLWFEPRFYFADGRQEKVMFDKITSRISKLCYGLHTEFVDPVSIIKLES